MEFKLNEEEVASMVVFAIENGGAPFSMKEPVIQGMRFHTGTSRYCMTVEVTPEDVIERFGSDEEESDEGESD